ncbi:MAG: M14 family metallopeptidase [Bdellovibrionota bacterium]
MGTLDMMTAFMAVFAFVLQTMMAFAHEGSGHHFVHLKAKDKFERSKIADLGVSIEAVVSDGVYGLASDEVLEKVKKSGLSLVETFRVNERTSPMDFPEEDARFHNVEEMEKAIDELVTKNFMLMRKFSIGKTFEGRDIWAVQVNSNALAHGDNPVLISAKPGIFFVGNHHAREHLSAEIPLMFLQYIAEHYGSDAEITNLVRKRDIYVVPMLNPDGVARDISTGKYLWHRKNTRPNNEVNPGVDLNRNYGYKWGQGGSSGVPSSDIYRGEHAFSEPETQAVKKFIEDRPNIKIVLSYHTFSELILYPWGYTYDKVEKEDDYKAHVAMAEKMAKWTGYTPQQSSELYITSGDTTDWVYGALGIFSFTFELSPKDMSGGAFYPGVKVIDKVFQDNIKPALYLTELADDPYRALLPQDDRLSWLDSMALLVRQRR